MTQPIRVLIVDDHHVVREGLSSFLNAVDDLELVAMAENGAQAIEQVAATLPDVVLMDVIMPQMNGIDAMKHILSTHPQVKVIMLTSFGDEEHIQQAIEYGASGYLLKDATIQDMAAAIRSAVAGRTTLSPEVTQTLLQAQRRPPPPAFNLKERELEVLRHLAKGSTNRQIAHKLSLSVSTIKFHVSNIFAELNAESRTEAVAIALKNGIIGGE